MQQERDGEGEVCGFLLWCARVSVELRLDECGGVVEGGYLVLRWKFGRIRRSTETSGSHWELVRTC